MTQSFYVTFMQKQAFKNLYVEVIAANEGQARDAMFAHFGDKWMTVYDDDESFNEQILRFRLAKLCGITVINYGTDEHEHLGYELSEDFKR